MRSPKSRGLSAILSSRNLRPRVPHSVPLSLAMASPSACLSPSLALVPMFATDTCKPNVPTSWLSNLDKGGSVGGGGLAAPADSPSLSLINNSIIGVNKSAIAKKAECLYVNLDGLIKRVGIERVGFVTLTFPRVTSDRVFASCCFNSLATNVLRPQKLEFLSVPERQGNGGFHFHLATAFPYDIRTGFDFTAATNATTVKREHYFRGGTYNRSRGGFGWDNASSYAEFKKWECLYIESANESLRSWWNYFRQVAKRYGFGRCETLPILSNAQALARYIGAYVSTASNARLVCDAGMRTVRYSFARVPVAGYERKSSLRTATVKFSWLDGNGRKWRRGLQLLGTIFELDLDGLSRLFGKKFQYHMRRAIFHLGDKYEEALPLVSKVPQWADYASRVAFFTRLLNSLQKEEIFDESILNYEN